MGCIWLGSGGNPFSLIKSAQAKLWHLLLLLFVVCKIIRLTLVWLDLNDLREPLLLWTNLWFQINVVFWRLLLLFWPSSQKYWSAWCHCPISASEWHQSDLKSKFHQPVLLTALWLFSIISQEKMLNVLRRAESIFMIWALPASIFHEQIGGQSGKRVPSKSPLTDDGSISRKTPVTWN